VQKGHIIAVWPTLTFCRIKPIFGWLTRPDMKNIIAQLFPLICASFLRNNIAKKLSFPSSIFWSASFEGGF